MSYRAGFVGLIGLPNSGKSTLMNAMVGEKVSIVTAKPQTTRRRMIGLLSSPEGQIVFVDAPGLVAARGQLNTFLRDEAHDVIAQSDVLVVMLNVDEKRVEHLDEVIALAVNSKKPWLALINKTDLPHLHRPQLLRERIEKLGNIPIIQGSSVDGAETLKAALLQQILPLLPTCGGPLYDEELYTLSNTRDLCLEIIREKCFEQLHQEVPFGLAVKMLKYAEDDGPVLKMYTEILVSKENHRPIVIGHGGSVLKKIGIEARKEIEGLVGRQVYLDLRVSSKGSWMKNPGLMKDLGYVVQKA